MAADKDDGHKRIAENRKARFEYRIEDTTRPASSSPARR